MLVKFINKVMQRRQLFEEGICVPRLKHEVETLKHHSFHGLKWYTQQSYDTVLQKEITKPNYEQIFLKKENFKIWISCHLF